MFFYNMCFFVLGIYVTQEYPENIPNIKFCY